MSTDTSESTRRENPTPLADAPARGPAVRPFRVQVPQRDLVELRRRVLATRWPEKETVEDTSQGVPLSPLQDLARHWATEYDWRNCEAKLNALPQFVTEIDGLDIHFIHVRSKHPSALPLLVAHGWPGSILHNLKIIGPLTDPTAHGGDAEDAFDVVLPSMPGYGFSGKPATTGWDPVRIARAYVSLMQRLGYARFVAQGGDWGAIIVEAMAVQAPPELVAIHSNMPGAIPTDVTKAITTGGSAPPGLSDEEHHQFERLKRFFAKNVFYAYEMATRPQTLYGIADSPVGLAAWLLDLGDGDDKPAAATSAAMRTPAEGQPRDRLTRDDVLDNITLYWLTNTGVSAARIYWENRLAFFDVKNVTIPVAVTAFPGELYQVPRSWAERAFPNLVYYRRAERGAHFPAWEEPALFVSELRAAFSTVR